MPEQCCQIIILATIHILNCYALKLSQILYRNLYAIQKFIFCHGYKNNSYNNAINSIKSKCLQIFALFFPSLFCFKDPVSSCYSLRLQVQVNSSTPSQDTWHKHTAIKLKPEAVFLISTLKSSSKKPMRTMKMCSL